MMSKQAHEFLLATSKGHNSGLFNIINRNGQLDVPKGETDRAFEFLFKTCVGQQLSVKAVSSIWGRVIELSEALGVTLLELADEKYSNKLRSCGISNNKIKSIINLRNRFYSEPGLSAEIYSADYKGDVDLICSNWGFGIWSADMCAMFFCGLEDVMPKGDVAINNGLLSLFKNTEDTNADIELYSPFKTHLCLHIWRALDDGHLSK